MHYKIFIQTYDIYKYFFIIGYYTQEKICIVGYINTRINCKF